MCSNSCWESIIKVKECLDGDCTSSTSLLLNSIPGLSIRDLSKLTDNERILYIDIIDSIVETSIERIETDISVNSGIKLIKGNEFCLGMRRFPLTTLTSTISPDYVGVILQVETGDLLKTIVKRIGFFYDQQIDTEFILELVDLDTGAVINTFTQTIKYGVNILNLSLELKADMFCKNYWLRYDKSKYKLRDTLPMPCQCGTDMTTSCQSNITINRNYYYNTPITKNTDCQPPLSYRGWNGKCGNYDSLYGLTIEVLSECSFSNYVCAKPELFKSALRYAMSLQFILESKFSGKINKILTMQMDMLESIENDLNKRYEKSIKQITDKVNELDLKECVKCEKNIGFKYFI